MKRAFEQIIAGPALRVLTSPPEYVDNQITCQDGTTLSVQVSETHYCSPRDNFGPYYQVEVGFPMTAEGRAAIPPRQEGETFAEYGVKVTAAIMSMPPAWGRYGDGHEADPDGDWPARPPQVWSYVPVELVRDFIEEHGGETLR